MNITGPLALVKPQMVQFHGRHPSFPDVASMSVQQSQSISQRHQQAQTQTPLSQPHNVVPKTLNAYAAPANIPVDNVSLYTRRALSLYERIKD